MTILISAIAEINPDTDTKGVLSQLGGETTQTMNLARVGPHHKLKIWAVLGEIKSRGRENRCKQGKWW